MREYPDNYYLTIAKNALQNATIVEKGLYPPHIIFKKNGEDKIFEAQHFASFGPGDEEYQRYDMLINVGRTIILGKRNILETPANQPSELTLDGYYEKFQRMPDEDVLIPLITYNSPKLHKTNSRKGLDEYSYDFWLATDWDSLLTEAWYEL